MGGAILANPAPSASIRQDAGGDAPASEEAAVPHPHALSPEQIADAERDGYLGLRDAIPAGVIDDLRAVYSATVDRSSSS